MNLLSNNYIWLLPTRTASRETVSIIKHNNLVIKPYNNINGTEYSHHLNILKEYTSLPVIVNVRNPYHRAFANWKLGQILNLNTNNNFNAYTDLRAFTNILNTPEVFTYNFQVKLNPVNTKLFAEWCNENLITDCLPDTEFKHIVYFEDFSESILKIPFLKKIPSTLKIKQYESNIKRYLTTHIIFSINKDVFNVKYYTDFIDKFNLLSSPLQYNAMQWLDFKNSLLNLNSKKLELIKQIFVLPENDNSTLIDANTLFDNNWKQYYNQQLADIVYKGSEYWFTKFNYSKGSWN